MEVQKVQNAMQSGAVGAAQYATSLAGLDKAQMAAATSLLGLNRERQKEVLTMAQGVAAAEGYTIQKFAEAMVSDKVKASEYAEMMAKSANKTVTDQLSASVLGVILFDEDLDEILKKLIVTQLGNMAATEQVTAANYGLAASAKAAGAAMIATPTGWLTLIITLLPLAITGIVKLYDWLVVTAEEARETANELHSVFEETANELENVNSELETSRDRLAELLKLSEAGTITIVEQEELDNLQKEVALLEQRERFLKTQKEREAKEANEALEAAFNKESFSSDLYAYVQEGLRQERDALLQIRKDWTEENEARYNEITASLSRLGEMAVRGNFDAIAGLRTDRSLEYADYIELLINRYNELDSIDLSEKTQAEIYEMDALKTRLSELGIALADYIQQYEGDNDITAFWQELADDIDRTVNKADIFARKMSDLPEIVTNRLSKQGSDGSLTADYVTALAGEYHELQTAMEESGATAEDVAAHFNALSVAQGKATDSTGSYTARLSDLSEVLSELQSGYNVLEAAQADMADGGGLSPETIKKLADAEENYLDYLYEENGVVKLNTEAWKENIEAKKKHEIDEVQKEINSLLAEQTRLLDERKGILEDLSYAEAHMDEGGWEETIAELTAALAENDQALAENEAAVNSDKGMLELLRAAFNGLQKSVQSASATFFDSISSLKKLYDLLNELENAKGLDLETYNELLALVPDLAGGIHDVKSAQEALRTAIAENERTAKSAYVAMFQVTEDWVSSVINSSGKLSNALATYYGEDVSNWKETANTKWKVDQELVKSLSDLWAKYHGVTDKEIKQEIADLKSRERYKIKVGEILGIENPGLNSVDQARLDELEAILRMRQQVAKDFEELANISFTPSGSGSSAKRVEEYIADIDKHREAVEALRKTRVEAERIESEIENAGSYEKKIALEKELIEAYKAEQAALRSLNNARGATIADGVRELRSLGFAVEYNADTNDLWISNIERLNELTAKNKGEYDTLQEATNALRQDTEDLINTITDLNDANREGSKNWLELRQSMIEAHIAQYEYALQASKNVIMLAENGMDNSIAAGNLEDAKKYSDVIVSEYQKMQQTLHEEAEYLRGEEYADTSDEVSALSDLWWDYADRIKDTVISTYEAIAAEHQNLITLTENWLDDAISNRDYSGVKQYSSAIISHYKQMQKTLHEEAEFLRKQGYSDTSDEVSKLSDLWWDYADNIKAVKEQVIDYLIDIADAAHDSADEILSVSNALHDAANEFVANDGFITVDTVLALRGKVGMQYMQMLKDENGLWEINEERINDVIAARTRQMAVEDAMSYVERLKLAAQEGSIENLDNLIFAAADATNSTWELVYAELELMHTMGELNDSQYQAALHNIEAMRGLAESAVQNIGKATNSLQDLLDNLEDMKDGADDLVKYVMDMLKHRIKEQIDLLEEMKDKYSELIQLKKDSLDTTKDEQDYQKSIAKKLKEMAKLQERINALSLDDSRSAQAERAKLLEELAALQEDLEDTQANKSVEAQKEALDQMEKDYHDEKDKEIKILEDSISSYQKLYDMAINYIHDNWETLKDQLIAWNTEYGTSLNSEIESAWEAGERAAKRYGDFVSAVLGGISDEIEALTGKMSNLNAGSANVDETGSGNTTNGGKNTAVASTREENIRRIIKQMYDNSQAWFTSDKQQRADLEKDQQALAALLRENGVNAVRDDKAGIWYVDRIGGEQLFEKYKKYITAYHTGGFVGDEPLKPNEQYIKAEKGELMMTSNQQDSLVAQLDRIGAMADTFSNAPVLGVTPVVGGGLSQAERGTINNITNNSRPIEINIGDTIIQGVASPETVAAHKKVTEDMVNEFARQVGMKW